MPGWPGTARPPQQIWRLRGCLFVQAYLRALRDLAVMWWKQFTVHQQMTEGPLCLPKPVLTNRCNRSYYSSYSRLTFILKGSMNLTKQELFAMDHQSTVNRPKTNFLRAIYKPAFGISATLYCIFEFSFAGILPFSPQCFAHNGYTTRITWPELSWILSTAMSCIGLYNHGVYL